VRSWCVLSLITRRSSTYGNVLSAKTPVQISTLYLLPLWCEILCMLSIVLPPVVIVNSDPHLPQGFELYFSFQGQMICYYGAISMLLKNVFKVIYQSHSWSLSKALGLGDTKPSGVFSIMANYSQYYNTRMANHNRQDLISQPPRGVPGSE
jgi:hypothetical protein